MSVSELGFGCWQLGGKSWGRFSQRDVVSAVEEALAAGVTLFDTAPVYGLGRSEELLGKALAQACESVVVVSKAGLVWDPSGRVIHDARPVSLRQQLLESLRRLHRERVEVYLLHWPDARVPLRESVDALESLRREGLIGAWGLSNHSVAALSLIHI